MDSTVNATSIGIASSPSLREVTCPYRRVSLTIVAAIHESCSYKIGPLAISMTVGRGCHHCSSDSSVWGSTVVLHVITIRTFCLFLTDNDNLIVFLHAQSLPLLFGYYASPSFWLVCLSFDQLGDLVHQYMLMGSVTLPMVKSTLG